VLRYFLVAGGIYWFFYSPFSQFFTNPDLPHHSPSLLSIQRDIKLSIFSAGIFALMMEFILSAYRGGITLIYSQYEPNGLWYLGISYGAVLILQDTYFYFTHRWFHHRSLFRWLHQGHHRSPDPTPWTSFAFDPLEAIIHSLFLLGIIFIIPLHFITLIAVLVTMTIWAVLNHLGIDRLPLSFPHHWLGRWFIGPAHHSIHHRNYSVHYGLYFTFWDKLLGTQDPSYEKQLSHSLQSTKTP
jgi:sterol desaturase/sphingolipid hydroxylase (fatty acid hydroxylase superfamily)